MSPSLHGQEVQRGGWRWDRRMGLSAVQTPRSSGFPCCAGEELCWGRSQPANPSERQSVRMASLSDRQGCPRELQRSQSRWARDSLAGGGAVACPGQGQRTGPCSGAGERLGLRAGATRCPAAGRVWCPARPLAGDSTTQLEILHCPQKSPVALCDLSAWQLRRCRQVFGESKVLQGWYISLLQFWVLSCSPLLPSLPTSSL